VSCKHRGWLLAAAMLASAVSCSRHSRPGTGRLAILRFENVGGDPASDWMGRAFSEVLASDLNAAPGIFVIPGAQLLGYGRALGMRAGSAPGISAERTQALMAGANRIGYGQYRVNGGRLEAQLAIEDPASRKTVLVAGAAGRAEDVLGVAGALARQVSAQAGPYGTASLAALRDYAAALESVDPGAARQTLEQAIAADPAFAPPYMILAQMKAAGQDRAGADELLRQALAHAAAMPEVDRARLGLQAATLAGDRQAVRQALAVLARANPNDPAVWRATGEEALGRRRYRDAVQALQKAAEVDPGEPANFNTLGYVAAYAGDLKTAAEALNRYRQLRPNEPNPLDSLGDVHYYLGRFREAEEYYLQAHGQDPNFLGGGTLYKAAMARLMTGDVAGADALARQYVEARQAARDPMLEYKKADWSWITGRRKEGFERLSAYASSVEGGALRELSSRAYAQLALWSLELGDRAGAARHAERAVSLASAGSMPVAAMARFLAQAPASPSDWAVRAEREFPEPARASFRNFARAYALLLAKEFADAVPLLREMYQASNPVADETLPVMLAWAYLETGHVTEAEPLLSANPLPSPAGPAPFASIYFPRILFLRGLLAEKQGNRGEAQKQYRLFLQLSGSQPLVWGEEARAAKG